MVGFYSIVMHSVAILTDGDGETVGFLHFIYKDMQHFLSLEVKEVIKYAYLFCTKAGNTLDA